MARAAAAAGGGPVAGLDNLEAELGALPEGSRRSVLALLGLAVGDCAGLPFELGAHRRNRLVADEVAASGTAESLQQLILERIVDRLGRHGSANAYARPFSDDTVCTDCKMAALAQCAELLRKPEYRGREPGALLWQCILSQLLAWRGGPAEGRLFQGYGGFTKGLLDPQGYWESKSFNNGEDLRGCSTWPEPWYADFAEKYCAGADYGSVKSYGNGAVMSFAPHALASVMLTQAGAEQSARALLPVLDKLDDTHQHESAKRGARLLHDLATASVRGEIASSADLRAAVRSSRAWQELLASPADRLAHPVQAFEAFLSHGDCSEAHVKDFVARLYDVKDPPLARAPFGVYAAAAGGEAPRLGQLLRAASNWDDDMRPGGGHASLQDGQAIRFSQRGLNSVLIAVWCCTGAQSCSDWLARLVYVGGDADTVGAVCGQIAGPLLPARDVCTTFRRFVALSDCRRKRPCAQVVTAAAERYAHRARLFCTGMWDQLAREPRLVDPFYDGLTVPVQRADEYAAESSSRRGRRAEGAERQDLTAVGEPVLRVLWVDRAVAGKGSYNDRGPGVWRRRAVETAEREWGVAVRKICSVDAALEALQMARCGVDDHDFDAVVTEQNFTEGGLEGLRILEEIDRLWGGVTATRPNFLLLTPYWDRGVVAHVRRRPRTCCVRHDSPKDIIDAVQRGACVAALVPDVVLPDLPGGPAEEEEGEGQGDGGSSSQRPPQLDGGWDLSGADPPAQSQSPSRGAGGRSNGKGAPGSPVADGGGGRSHHGKGAPRDGGPGRRM